MKQRRPGKQPGRLLLAILNHLAEIGPSTRAEMESASGLILGGAINRLRHVQGCVPQRIYVCGWTREAEGKKDYERAVYDLGDKPDEPRPYKASAKRRSVASTRKYSKANAGQVPSVFHLADPNLREKPIAAFDKKGVLNVRARR